MKALSKEYIEKKLKTVKSPEVRKALEFKLKQLETNQIVLK